MHGHDQLKCRDESGVGGLLVYAVANPRTGEIVNEARSQRHIMEHCPHVPFPQTPNPIDRERTIDVGRQPGRVMKVLSFPYNNKRYAPLQCKFNSEASQ